MTFDLDSLGLDSFDQIHSIGIQWERSWARRFDLNDLAVCRFEGGPTRRQRSLWVRLGKKRTSLEENGSLTHVASFARDPVVLPGDCVSVARHSRERTFVLPNSNAHGGASGAPTFWGTTILSVRRDDEVALGGDGQVTLGDTVMKADAVKIRRLHEKKVIVGFAGSVADSFALLERFEKKLSTHRGQLLRAATELSRDWRTDRVLRRLESMLAVVDSEHSLLLSGNGEVIAPSDGIIAIGSGGGFARAAAQALLSESTLTASEIVRRALEIAGDICIYSNRNIHVEVLGKDS